jgi:hypothetical protein
VKVGFTGTRQGMTEVQCRHTAALLAGATEAHHGDCVGADEQFHELCLGLGVPVVLHPPIDDRLRAFCLSATHTLEARPYLERNRDIVNICDLLIAAPKEADEPDPARGQGTWSTIRYARRVGRQMRLLWPE